MNVSQLQSFLASLSQPLSASGAKKVAEDLGRACAALEPFREWSLTQFADFLAAADQYAKTGVVPTAGRSKTGRSAAKPGDPQALAAAIEQVRAFFDRVTSPEVSYTAIETEVKRLEKQFKKDDLFEIAKALGITAKLKTKKDAAAEIQRLMSQRKETFERTRF